MEQLRTFVAGDEAMDIQPQARNEAYRFVRDTLDRFDYRKFGRLDKGLVLRFLVSATGSPHSQMERLVRQWRRSGNIRDRRGSGRGKPCAHKYAPADIRLLADIERKCVRLKNANGLVPR